MQLKVWVLWSNPTFSCNLVFFFARSFNWYIFILSFSAMLFSGNENSIFLTREYFQEYSCEFDLLYYPFDTQVIDCQLLVRKIWLELKKNLFYMNIRYLTSNFSHWSYEYLNRNLSIISTRCAKWFLRFKAKPIIMFD